MRALVSEDHLEEKIKDQMTGFRKGTYGTVRQNAQLSYKDVVGE